MRWKEIRHAIPLPYSSPSQPLHENSHVAGRVGEEKVILDRRASGQILTVCQEAPERKRHGKELPERRLGDEAGRKSISVSRTLPPTASSLHILQRRLSDSTACYCISF